jgi:hypothetical protein
MTLTIKKILYPRYYFCLSNCTQSGYISSNGNNKNPIMIIIMPDQKCNEKEHCRLLVRKKISHPGHKECYYK